MSLPFALDHINLWLLKDEDGWSIVDTGINTKQTCKAWEQVVADFLTDKPIRRVIVTHLHPEHIGLSGWLTKRFNCPLWISEKEYEFCAMIIEITTNQIPDSAINFY